MSVRLLFLLFQMFFLWISFETYAESYNTGWITYSYNPNFDTEEPEASVSKIRWVTNVPQHIIIPEHIEIDNVLYSVTSIEDEAAERLSPGIDSVSIPNTVKVIGEYAFAKSNLRYIKIGTGVTNIKNNAFKDCTYLKAVEIEDLDAWCRIEFGTRYDGSSNISEITYYENANPLKCAHYLYIKGQLVTELVIPKSITSINLCAFTCGFFSNIKFHSNIKEIGDNSFLNAEGLETLDLSDTSVWGIGQYAFSQISTLKTVKLSRNISSIGLGAFSHDENVNEIWSPAIKPPHVSFTNTIEPFYYIDFDKYNSTYYKATLHIPKGCLDSYKGASIWSKFQHIEEDEAMNSTIDEYYTDNIKIYSKSYTVFVIGNFNEIIQIFDISGKQIYIGNDSQIHIPHSGIYFVLIGRRIYKVLV